jgi:hypothetical protein
MMGMMGRSPCKIRNEEILEKIKRPLLKKTTAERDLVTECKTKPTALLILLLEKSDICPASCPRNDTK